MSLFKYAQNPSGGYAFVEAQNEADAIASVGAGNYKTDYGFLHVDAPKGTGGLADYNDQSTQTLPLNIAADTWTDIPNDGNGSYTNLGSLPKDVSRLLNTATGKLDLSKLDIGDNALIRNDFTINASAADADIDLRYVLGNGAGEYTIDRHLGTIHNALTDERIVSPADMIYIGDDNTKDNPVKLQIKSSKAITFKNNGIAINITKGG